MEVKKLDSLEKVAKEMSQVLSIGINETDKYKVSDRIIYLQRDVKTKEIYIVDASSKELIGTPIDGSKCAGQHFKTTDMITELLKANFGN